VCVRVCVCVCVFLMFGFIAAEAVTQGEVIMLCCHSDSNHTHLIHLQLEQIYKYAIRLARQR